MPSTTNVNILLGQVNAVNEIHNIRKQNLRLNQQIVDQETEGKKKEDKAKVRQFEASDKVALQEDEQEKGDKGVQMKGKHANKRKSKGESRTSGGNCIDIRV